ncbi:MAG TPA: hypothetical protein EYG03_03330 [Planctomycetes bacterium]|nr:hypothetical protein [Planctomycetota bacterium]
MPEMTEQDAADDAREALASIQAMEKTALCRAIPSRWFGASIAVLAGALVTLSAADRREYHVYVILLMSAVMVYRSRKTGVSVRQFPTRVAGIAFIVLAPLFFGLIVASQKFSEAIGTVGAPLAAGIVLASAVYLLSMFERRWHITRIGSGKGE